MSKLKIAKAVKKTYNVLGVVLLWAGITAAVLTAGWLLWTWASLHFLSFIVIVGLFAAFFALGGIIELHDWSTKTIEKAEAEEQEAQARSRAEKREAELKDSAPKPPKTIPNYDYAFEDESFGRYR